MEFWGVEVPAGKPTSCLPGHGMYLHVSQAALGESKEKNGKGNSRVLLKVHIDETEVLLGTLSEGKCDQMPLDLVFDREFSVSHNSTSSSVYICGYRTEGPEEEDSDDEELDEDEDEEDEAPVAVPIAANGAAAGKPTKAGKVEIAVKVPAKAQPTTNVVIKAEKKSVKKQVVESSSDEEEDSDEEDELAGHPFVSDLASESDDEFDAGDDSDEDMDEDDDDEDEEDDEDDSDESEEEELKIEAPKAGKKRAAAALTKSAEKKSKTDAPTKPGNEGAAEYWQSLIAAGSKGQSPASGKKGGKAGPATPVGKAAAPAEVKTPSDKGSKAAKTPKGTPTTAPPTPVSEKKIGQYKCTGCERTFTTESAMGQHSAAKHKA